MSSHAPDRARVVPLRRTAPAQATERKEPLWRDVVGDVLRRERLLQERTLKDVSDAARISMPYLSELERGRKEASSEVLAAAARALGLGLTDLLGLAQGELARRAAPSRGTPPPAPNAAAPARPRPQAAEGHAASPREDGAPATPVARLATRRAPRAATRQGEVRLAA